MDLDLRRHVGARVPLLEHGERRELGIAQILFEIRVARARRERRLVVAFHEHGASFFGEDDRGAGVLAHRQHAPGGNIGVLDQIIGDEPVVLARLGIVEDRAQLPQMARAEQMVDVDERRLGELPQRVRRDDDDLAAQRFFDPHAAAIELAVGGPVLAEREQRRVATGRGDLDVHGP